MMMMMMKMFRFAAAGVSVMLFVLENMLMGFDLRISPQFLCQNYTLHAHLDHLRLIANRYISDYPHIHCLNLKVYILDVNKTITQWWLQTVSLMNVSECEQTLTVWLYSLHTLTSNKTQTAFLLWFTGLCFISCLHLSLCPVCFCSSVVSDASFLYVFSSILHFIWICKIRVQVQIKSSNNIKSIPDDHYII